ncbi:hypothetical protein GGF32_005338 [Allomyces javanicus]|nr:hypothetical protein GGF32_005338 [Allomyces javanicus]
MIPYRAAVLRDLVVIQDLSEQYKDVLSRTRPRRTSRGQTARATSVQVVASEDLGRVFSDLLSSMIQENAYLGYLQYLDRYHVPHERDHRTDTKMTSSMNVAVFNRMLLGVLGFLQKRFPDDRDIVMSVTQVKAAMNLAPREPCLVFIQAAIPYEDKIVRRDEGFFLGMLGDDDALRGFNLGEKWSSLSPVERDYLWKSVAKMLVLGKQILGL